MSHMNITTMQEKLVEVAVLSINEIKNPVERAKQCIELAIQLDTLKSVVPTVTETPTVTESVAKKATKKFTVRKRESNPEYTALLSAKNEAESKLFYAECELAQSKDSQAELQKQLEEALNAEPKVKEVEVKVQDQALIDENAKLKQMVRSLTEEVKAGNTEYINKIAFLEEDNKSLRIKVSDLELKLVISTEELEIEDESLDVDKALDSCLVSHKEQSSIATSNVEVNTNATPLTAPNVSLPKHDTTMPKKENVVNASRPIVEIGAQCKNGYLSISYDLYVNKERVKSEDQVFEVDAEMNEQQTFEQATVFVVKQLFADSKIKELRVKTTFDLYANSNIKDFNFGDGTSVYYSTLKTDAIQKRAIIALIEKIKGNVVAPAGDQEIPF